MKFSTILVLILVAVNISFSEMKLKDPEWTKFGDLKDETYKDYRFETGKPEEFNEENYNTGAELGDTDPTVKAFLFVVNELIINGKDKDNEKLSLNLKEAISFSKEIQSKYINAPYHNRKHPADMLIRFCFWYKKIQNGNDGTVKKAISELSSKQLFSLIIAITGHDVGHPGITNANACTENLYKNLNIDNSSSLKTYGEKICSLKIDDKNEKNPPSDGLDSVIEDKIKNTSDPNKVESALKSDLTQKVLDKFSRNLESLHSYITNKVIFDLVTKREKENENDLFHQVLGNLYKNKDKIYDIRNRGTAFNLAEFKKSETNDIDKYIMSTNFAFGKDIKALLTKEGSNLEEIIKNDKTDFLAFFIMALDIANPTSPNLIESLKLSNPVICEFVTESAFVPFPPLKKIESSLAQSDSQVIADSVVENLRKDWVKAHFEDHEFTKLVMKTEKFSSKDSNLLKKIGERAIDKQKGFYSFVLPVLYGGFLLKFEKAIGVRDEKTDEMKNFHALSYLIDENYFKSNTGLADEQTIKQTLDKAKNNKVKFDRTVYLNDLFTCVKERVKNDAVLPYDEDRGTPKKLMKSKLRLMKSKKSTK